MIVQGDARQLPFADKVANCCVTSPPYWGLRDYGVLGQLGLERTPEEYISNMVSVFREVKRVLRDDGTLWLNMGDSYAGSWGNYHPNSPSGKHGQRLKEKARWKRPAYSSQEFLPTANCPGLKPKDLVGIPWMLAFALRADGWYLRSDIIWHKPNPMPESVTDRPTKAHEYLFLMSKSEQYFYDADAIAEQAQGWNGSRFDDPRDLIVRPNTGRQLRRGLTEEPKRHGLAGASACGVISMGCGETRNKRSVWTVTTNPFPEAHFATFPEDLIKPCILAGCPVGGVVLDPFIGSGTTELVARNMNCRAIGVELNMSYIQIAKKRLSQQVLEFK